EDVEVGWVASLTALDASSNPIGGAAVRVLDQDGNSVFTGTTDANGQIPMIPLVVTTIAQNGTDTTTQTKTTKSRFSVVVTNGTKSVAQAIDRTGNQNLKVQL